MVGLGAVWSSSVVHGVHTNIGLAVVCKVRWWRWRSVFGCTIVCTLVCTIVCTVVCHLGCSWRCIGVMDTNTRVLRYYSRGE